MTTGYCLKCREKVVLENTRKTVEDGRRIIKGTCPGCGKKVVAEVQPTVIRPTRKPATKPIDEVDSKKKVTKPRKPRKKKAPAGEPVTGHEAADNFVCDGTGPDGEGIEEALEAIIGPDYSGRQAQVLEQIKDGNGARGYWMIYKDSYVRIEEWPAGDTCLVYCPEGTIRPRQNGAVRIPKSKIVVL